MSLKDDLISDIASVLDATWDVRDGQVVPDSSDVALSGGGVKLNATILYADLADSTALAMWNRGVAAKVFKAFLAGSTRLIRGAGGSVRSFDGDRVMGVFVGGTKNSSAAKCALQINWMFLKVLRPKFEAKYEKLRDGTFKLAHCTGVDVSDVLVVRGGIRNNNDLIWVGRAPNVAAKLSAIRQSPHHSFISGEVFDGALKSSKTTSDGREMWEEMTWKNAPISRCYRSSWTWAP